jgi:4-hydroxyphenylacetate 3-hydroxylase N terminal
MIRSTYLCYEVLRNFRHWRFVSFSLASREVPECRSLMTVDEYRESLRELSPRVFVNGQAIESVADEPSLEPGIAAIGVSYELAHSQQHCELMTGGPGPTTTQPRVTTYGHRDLRHWRPIRKVGLRRC